MGVKQRIQEMTSLRTILLLSLISMSLAAVGKDQKTFGWMGDLIFGNCDTSTCGYDTYRARECCNSGRNTRCCSYVGGGGWDNGGWNNGGNYNNNKPGSCPPYNGRRKRSPEDAPWLSNSAGRHFGNGGGHYGNGGGHYGNGGGHYGNGGGWNSGGSGYNPGYGNGGGRCIRDSECPGSLKCCYLYSGYQCTQPQFYG